MPITKENAKVISRLGGLAAASISGHLSRAGKIGGRKVSEDRDHMRRIGRLGGLAKAAAAKRKGQGGR